VSTGIKLRWVQESESLSLDKRLDAPAVPLCFLQVTISCLGKRTSERDYSQRDRHWWQHCICMYVIEQAPCHRTMARCDNRGQRNNQITKLVSHSNISLTALLYE
jgi:hypothetical protein